MRFTRFSSIQTVVPTFILASAVLFGILILLPGAASQEASSSRSKEVKAGDIKIMNKTSGLIVLDIQPEREHLKVRLKNISKKTITAYDVAVGIGTIGTECLTGDDENNVMLPGGVREEIYPVQNGIAERGIVILSVFFEDGSAEGDSQSIQYTKEYRLGMKRHREYALRFLQDALKSPKVEISKALINLESLPSPLSEDELNALPSNVKLGYNAERSRFLRTISSVKHTFEHSFAAEVQSANNQKQQDSHREAQKALSALLERYLRTSNEL